MKAKTMNEHEIRDQLEALRREGNSPKATLWDQRRILKRRRELHALLAELEREHAD